MKQHMSWRALSLAVVIACVFWGSTALAQEDDGGAYWTNPDGEVYVDSDGNCWQSPNVPKQEPRAECGDVVAQPETDGDEDGDGVPDSRDQCPGTPIGTEVDARGCPLEKEAPIVLRGVTFEFDKATLTPQATSRLDNVVDALQASDSVAFRIDGYTDSIGSERYNQDLSQRRVNSVREYLINHGISSRRITGTEGHGESNPVASNDTKAGRAQNRRVELNVTGQ